MKRVVLAYSGGLDTSVIVHWLKQRYGCEVVCYCCDVGQGGELDGLEERALALGASSVVVEDLRHTFVHDYAFPTLRAGALYEGRYLLGTSIARPLIAARQVACARAVGADAVAHGCTGKGNDQVRFELTYMALAPDLEVVAPWRSPDWTIVSREDALDYCARHNLPIPMKKSDLFSRDGNAWHLSHEGGPLEDPWTSAPESMYRLTAAPADRPPAPETITIGFDEGWPVSVDGRALDPVHLLAELNQRAGRHGVGRADIVESRVIGMKSRGVYETPGGTVLFEALEDLCRLTLTHEVLRARAEFAPRMADLVYQGQWFAPVREALTAFVDKALEPVTGEVMLELFQGSARAIARRSPRSLYDAAAASFDMTGYEPRHAEGFIKIFGQPIATALQAGATALHAGAPAEDGAVKGETSGG